jgi:hypothetical protein
MTTAQNHINKVCYHENTILYTGINKNYFYIFVLFFPYIKIHCFGDYQVITIMNYNVLLNYDVKQYTYTTFEYCEILFSCEETILPFLLIRTSRNKTISICWYLYLEIWNSWNFYYFEIIIIFNRSLLKQFTFIIYCLSFRRTRRYRLRFINLFLFDIVILYVCNLLLGIMSCMIYNVHVKELKFVDRLIFMDCS